LEHHSKIVAGFDHCGENFATRIGCQVGPQII
jgi:hypothetical protein